jgi:hypothetical protein
VTEILGILGLALFIVGVIALAAAVTYVVIKVSPNPEEKRAKKAAEGSG